LKSANPFLFRNGRQAGQNAIFDRRSAHPAFEIIGLLLFAGIWAAVSWFIFTRPQFMQFHGFLPGPTVSSLIASFQDERFWFSVFASLRRIVVGIGIAAVIGFPTGIIVGYFPRIQTLSYSAFQFIRMISPLSWMPIALLLFASFESAVYFLIVMATVCPIILNTSVGVSTINPQLIRMALNQGASDAQIIRTIILPASYPRMMTSLRLALGVAWIVLVPAEFLGVSSGLGYLINDARDTMEYDKLMAMIIAIGIIGFVLDRIIQRFQITLGRY
jgi:NitT/TauT family transport system permease protein